MTPHERNPIGWSPLLSPSQGRFEPFRSCAYLAREVVDAGGAQTVRISWLQQERLDGDDGFGSGVLQI